MLAFGFSVNLSPLPGPAFVCDRCPECCRTVRVPVTHHDLMRLHVLAQLPPSTLVEWLSPNDIDMSGEPESFVETRRGRRLLVLRHEGGACALLDGNGRCSVHHARPAACVAYPFALCGTEVEPLPDAPCRVPHAVDRQLARLAAACVERELLEYVALVAGWNRRQRRRRQLNKGLEAPEAFVSFLSTTRLA